MPKFKEVLPGYYEFHCPGCRQSHLVNTNPDFGGVWEFNSDVNSPTVSPSLLVNVGGLNKFMKNFG